MPLVTGGQLSQLGAATDLGGSAVATWCSFRAPLFVLGAPPTASGGVMCHVTGWLAASAGGAAVLPADAPGSPVCSAAGRPYAATDGGRRTAPPARPRHQQYPPPPDTRHSHSSYWCRLVLVPDTGRTVVCWLGLTSR